MRSRVGFLCSLAVVFFLAFQGANIPLPPYGTLLIDPSVLLIASQTTQRPQALRGSRKLPFHGPPLQTPRASATCSIAARSELR